jgi:zinc-finger of acetyl-transferase ESCO
MRSNFIEITNSYGRCRICDFHYSKDEPAEAREHRGYHKRYLRECDEGWAPVNREDRERMMKEGAELLRHGATFSERMRGAELQLESLFHDHLAAVLRGTESRRSYFELVTDMDTSGRLDGMFDPDIADELSHRYSNRPRR